MATQKKAAAKKGIKVRDLKPSKDAKGGAGKHLDARSPNIRNADLRVADARKNLN